MPNLSLQGPNYIHHQLWKFRQGVRENSRMVQPARQISEKDIADTAAYFGAVEPLVVTRDVPEDLLAAGQSIAQNGVPEAGVPACLICHGEQATLEIAVLPRLLGQNRSYLEKRLDQIAVHGGDEIYEPSPMPRLASRMTDEQREAAAAWFSAQVPLAKQ